MTRRFAAVLLVAAVLVAAAACGDDDNGGKDSSASTTASTQPSGSSTTRKASGPECKELTILLKPDVTAAQKKAIEAKLKSIEQVKSWRFDAKGGAGGGAAYKVVPDSAGDEATIGNQFALDGVVSVVYPNQVC